MNGLIFDLDGTLIDSAPDIQAAVNKMLAEEGISPLDLATVISFIGNGMPKLVERVLHAVQLPLDRHSALYEKTLLLYNQAPSALSQPYEGVVEMLEILAAQGHRLAICTNKPAEPAQQILQDFNLERFFEVVVGGDSLSVKKPNPAPLQHCVARLGASAALYIGDSEVDYETAQQAQIPFIFFTGGYRNASAAFFQNAHHIDQFSALPALADSLLKRP